MAFLNLALDYEDHPKTRRLVGLLGRGSEILPIRLWTYCGKYHCKDGRLSGYSPQEIESIVRWHGGPGKALEALVGAGFLEKVKDGFRVHDWKAHQGHIHSLKVRNQKVARNRWKNINKPPSTVDTSGIPESKCGVPRSVPFPSVPNRTSKSLTLGETTLRAHTKPKGNGLVDEIVVYCNDEKSRGMFALAEKNLGDGMLRELFGELKSRVREGKSIDNKGAYLTRLIKDQAERLAKR